jgi:hypothetical protein
MARPRQRACLQDGLTLDLNRLARKGFVRRGANIGVQVITWTHSYWGEIATGMISADISGPHEGWFRIQLGSLDQRIILVPRARHFGGHQRYFICPVTGRLASVLWRPPGAKRFCSREAWKRQVAYATQFLDRDNRAHHGQSKINARLCSIGKLDREDWDFPPKPKWMRWKTYRRYECRFERYDAILDTGIIEFAAKLGLE